MIGERLDDGEFSKRLAHEDEPVIKAGDYGRVLRHPDGWTWMACTPSGHIGDLSAYTVVEHEDRTITVSPSILVSGGKSVLVDGDDAEQYERLGLVGQWHGYLERGVWREC